MDTQTLLTIKDLFMQNPAAVVGLAMPPLIDILNKDIAPEKQTERFLSTFAICFCVAAIFNLNNIMVNSWGAVFTSFGLIFTESQLVYKTYFKDSYLRSKLLERVYDPKPELYEIENAVG